MVPSPVPSAGARDPGMRLEHRGLPEAIGALEESLPLAVLDFVGIEYGESAAASVAGAVRIAQAVEFAHHIDTRLAFEALRQYRRDFTAGAGGDVPYSGMSVLALHQPGR